MIKTVILEWKSPSQPNREAWQVILQRDYHHQELKAGMYQYLAARRFIRTTPTNGGSFHALYETLS